MIDSEAIIDFLEVIVNQILYLRGVYPSQIFQKVKAFNLPVFISIYPPLNNYLKNVLIEASSHLTDGNLNKVEVRLYKDPEKKDTSYESYFIEINQDMNSEMGSEKIDEYLDEDRVQTEFRNCVQSLDVKSKSLNKLSENCQFKIFLHVNSFDHKSNLCQDFLWVEENVCKEDESKGIIPIYMALSPTNVINFYNER